eukprot:1136399-Pelagomonas_calceolata.AAC.1
MCQCCAACLPAVPRTCTQLNLYAQVIRHYHGHLSGVYSLALHPKLDVLMTGGRDSVCRVWDMRTKVQVRTVVSEGLISGRCVSHVGRAHQSASVHGYLRVRLLDSVNMGSGAFRRGSRSCSTLSVLRGPRVCSTRCALWGLGSALRIVCIAGAGVPWGLHGRRNAIR